MSGKDTFSGRERITVAVVLLAYLFIVSQVAVHLGLFGLGLSGIRPRAVGGPGPKPNLLARSGVTLTASSRFEGGLGVEALIDGQPRSYWHISMEEAGRPATITADFGEGQKVAVRSVSALPRLDLPSQFLRRADIAGSDDGISWQPAAEIVMGESPELAGWWKWEFPNDRGYRFWRLRVTRGHADGSRRNFYSLAELAFTE